MHEYSAVHSLTSNVLRELESRGISRVQQVRLRRGITFSEDALYQAFCALAPGTPLEDATLSVETVIRHVQCACGQSQDITDETLIGHMVICPACGIVHDIDEALDLEVIEIVVDDASAG